MENTELQKNIGAILFWKGEPVKFKELAKILNVKESEIKDSLDLLKEHLNSVNIGLQVNATDSEVALVTNESSSKIIENLQKEELDKDLSKSAIETLSIIIYRGPVRKSEIDYIRGVNSQFILRNLLIRGLIEKVANPNDERGYLYKSSIDLLNHLGISDIKEMDEYEKVNEDIKTYLKNEERE